VLHALCRVWKPYCGYLGRILMLTLLALDIVEAILDGRQPEGMRMPGLMKPFATEWTEQRTSPAPAEHAIHSTDASARP